MKIFLSKQRINIIISANLTNFKFRSWCRKEIKYYFEIYLEVTKNTLLKKIIKIYIKMLLKEKSKMLLE